MLRLVGESRKPTTLTSSAGIPVPAVVHLCCPSSLASHWAFGCFISPRQVPDGWERKDAEISGRRKLIVYTSPKNPGANAFVAYTPARGDFTTLGGFPTSWSFFVVQFLVVVVVVVVVVVRFGGGDVAGFLVV